MKYYNNFIIIIELLGNLHPAGTMHSILTLVRPSRTYLQRSQLHSARFLPHIKDSEFRAFCPPFANLVEFLTIRSAPQTFSLVHSSVIPSCTTRHASCNRFRAALTGGRCGRSRACPRGGARRVGSRPALSHLWEGGSTPVEVKGMKPQGRDLLFLNSNSTSTLSHFRSPTRWREDSTGAHDA